MPFQPGHKLSPGRRAGVPNKRTLDFQQTLEKHNFNVAEALMYCFKEAKSKYKDYAQRFEDNRISPMEDNGPKYLRIAADMAKELASYSYPKLKAIEHKKGNLLEGMTSEQKLEFMKQAVLRLEMELKNGTGSV